MQHEFKLFGFDFCLFFCLCLLFATAFGVRDLTAHTWMSSGEQSLMPLQFPSVTSLQEFDKKAHFTVINISSHPMLTHTSGYFSFLPLNMWHTTCSTVYLCLLDSCIPIIVAPESLRWCISFHLLCPYKDSLRPKSSAVFASYALYLILCLAHQQLLFIEFFVRSAISIP